MIATISPEPSLVVLANTALAAGGSNGQYTGLHHSEHFPQRSGRPGWLHAQDITRD